MERIHSKLYTLQNADKASRMAVYGDRVNPIYPTTSVRGYRKVQKTPDWHHLGIIQLFFKLAYKKWKILCELIITQTIPQNRQTSAQTRTDWCRGRQPPAQLAEVLKIIVRKFAMNYVSLTLVFVMPQLYRDWVFQFVVDHEGWAHSQHLSGSFQGDIKYNTGRRLFGSQLKTPYKTASSTCYLQPAHMSKQLITVQAVSIFLHWCIHHRKQKYSLLMKP